MTLFCTFSLLEWIHEVAPLFFIYYSCGGYMQCKCATVYTCWVLFKCTKLLYSQRCGVFCYNNNTYFPTGDLGVLQLRRLAESSTKTNLRLPYYILLDETRRLKFLVGPFSNDIELWGTGAYYKSDYEGCNFIAAFDLTSGALVWHKFLITSNYMRITEAFLDFDNNVVISGDFSGIIFKNTTNIMESSKNAIFVCKFRTIDGTTLWCSKPATAATFNDAISGNAASRVAQVIVAISTGNQFGFVHASIV